MIGFLPPLSSNSIFSVRFGDKAKQGIIAMNMKLQDFAD
jgi:hypothetical protein